MVAVYFVLYIHKHTYIHIYIYIHIYVYIYIYIYCGANQSLEGMIALLEHGGGGYPQLDIAMDARAVSDAVAAADARDLQECSL